MTKEEAIIILKDIRFDFNTRVNSETCIGEACMIGIKALEEQKIGRWIPVSERMPKDRQMVLFCDIEDDIKIGYHIKGRPDTHFSQDGTFDDIKNVKAWMPLPEAYEESEEEE